MSTPRKHRRLDKIERAASDDGQAAPWSVLPPGMTGNDVSDPPSDLEEPVYADGYGWMEKAKVVPKALIWTHPERIEQSLSNQ